MANRPTGYGMTADLKRKQESKYDPELAREAGEWISRVTGETVPTSDSNVFMDALNDGKILCKLINTLRPGSVTKVSDSGLAFKKMENIGKFLSAIEAYGVPKLDSFQTVDLYEKQNPPQVVSTIHALGRKAQAHNFNGPTLGVKESTTNVRHFTEEQMSAGKNIIGLQMGTNKGANQAGMNMGKQRKIID